MEEKGKIIALRKSLLVPSVKEIVANNNKCLSTVPEKYVVHQGTDRGRPILHHHDDDDLQVPIINMQNLISGDENEINNLHLACQQWGFFQLVNHGISASLIEKFKLETQEFFNIPIEEKKKYWQTTTDVEGFGQAFVVSEEQKLDWADIFFLTTCPKHHRKPNLLPMLPLPYRDTLDIYSVEMQKLAVKVLDCMAKALNIEGEAMRDVFGELGHQSIRLNYYPPCPEPNKVMGLTPHSDSAALTILLQLNEMEGLQIWKDQKWVPIKPLPNAFVVNVGDILEIASNGIYQSILHRAVVNASKERLSVAAFYSPSIDKEIGPIPDFITPLTPARFRRIHMTDYVNELFSRALDKKSHLDNMRVS